MVSIVNKDLFSKNEMKPGIVGDFPAVSIGQGVPVRISKTPIRTLNLNFSGILIVAARAIQKCSNLYRNIVFPTGLVFCVTSCSSKVARVIWMMDELGEAVCVAIRSMIINSWKWQVLTFSF